MRPLPHDKIAEKTVVGFMIFGKHMHAILSELAPEDFYLTAHRAIAAACIDLFRDGQPVDALTVAEHLERAGQLDSVGGREYLGACVGLAFSDAVLDGAITIVKDAALLRHGYAATLNASSQFANPAERAEDLITELQTKLTNLTARRNRARTIENNVALEKAFEHLDPDRPATDAGIMTGYNDLDYKTGGMQRGELILLAARPSMGKTSLMLNIAANVAKTGHKVYIFTLEMTARALAWRLLFSEAKVDMHMGKTGMIHRPGNEDKLHAVHAAFSALQNLPLWYNETSFNIHDIAAISQREASARGVDLICIDYLGLAQSGMRGASRNDEVAFMAGQVKRLAKELNVPVLCLSQLSRVNETQGVKRPALHALRDSGALEQDADAVWFLHSDEYYKNQGTRPDKWETALIVAKQRNGPTGEVMLDYMRPYTRFFGRHASDEKELALPMAAARDWYDN